jgi:hypothetical protein
MSEDKFFQMVQGKLENFSPEVPQAAYAGMRRKYAVSKFMSWNAGRLNVWYALLLVGMTSAAVVVLNSNTTESATQAVTSPVETSKLIVEPTQLVSAEQPTCSNTTCVKVAQSAKVKMAKGNGNDFVAIPTIEVPVINDINPTPFVSESPEVNIQNHDTPKVEEIVKAKEEPVKPKTILTISVYENKDK